ncbi:MAG: class I SAM-dependent methyltransferase [Burkholderiales bacterium]
MTERFSPTIQIDQAQRFIAVVDCLNQGEVAASLALFRLHKRALVGLSKTIAAQLPSAPQVQPQTSRDISAPSKATLSVLCAPSSERYSPSIRVDHAVAFVKAMDVPSEGSVDADFEEFRAHRVEMGNMGGALDKYMPRGAVGPSDKTETTESLPELPNEDLRWRVAGHRDATQFWETGRQSVANINSMLAIVGTSFESYEKALDFGCGCGRVLLHMKELGKDIELYGVDIDPDAIEWCRAHIPWARTSVSAWRPPLEFPDGYFDLVFNQSVFTHLDEDYQDVWLQELMRVTRPGAAIVLSIAGEGPFTDFIHSCAATSDPTPHVEAFRNKGFVYISSDGWDNGPFPDFYHSTFHAPRYIYEHWGRYFDIKAYVVRGSLRFQDYLLLLRRDGPPQPLEKPPWQIGRNDPLRTGETKTASISQRAYRKACTIAKGVLK